MRRSAVACSTLQSAITSLSQYDFATHCCVSGKQNTLISPRILHILDIILPFFALPCRAKQWNHHVFQLFFRGPAGAHGAMPIWWKGSHQRKVFPCYMKYLLTAFIRQIPQWNISDCFLKANAYMKYFLTSFIRQIPLWNILTAFIRQIPLWNIFWLHS